MTEVCGSVPIRGLFWLDQRVVAPSPTLEGKVINEAGETLPVGEAGELLVKGARDQGIPEPP